VTSPRDLLREALRDTTPDPERDAAGRDYFGSVYLAPGEDPPPGVGGWDASFRQIASVAFRGGWHAARAQTADQPPSRLAGVTVDEHRDLMAEVSAIRSVLSDVLVERIRQNGRWGEQNHPDGTGPEAMLLGFPFTALRDSLRDSVDRAARYDGAQWAGILLEEVFEAIAEDDPAALRRELIQVAAVAASWAEAIDRRTAREVTR
jgi:hypothetical protein